MSYTQILYHIVLRTKYNIPAIPLDKAPLLYRYIWGIIRNKKGALYRINGIEDHVHIISDLHPSVALASFVKDIKVSSSLWMKNNPHFPLFDGWSEGYCALTYSHAWKERVISYVKNQHAHHEVESTQDEIARILKEEGVPFNSIK